MDAPDVIVTPEVLDVYFYPDKTSDERERLHWRTLLKFNTTDGMIARLAQRCMTFKGHHEWYSTGSLTNVIEGFTMYGQLCSCGTFRVVSEAHRAEVAPPKKMTNLWGE